MMDSNLLEEYQQIVEKCNNLRPIKITNGWEVVWNHFPDVDPMTLDEDSDAWFDFSEDMALFRYSHDEKYAIDLGWYGGMNKEGMYGVSLFESDKYDENKLLEVFQTQSVEEITLVLNYFFTIPYLKS